MTGADAGAAAGVVASFRISGDTLTSSYGVAAGDAASAAGTAGVELVESVIVSRPGLPDTSGLCTGIVLTPGSVGIVRTSAVGRRGAIVSRPELTSGFNAGSISVGRRGATAPSTR